MWVAIIRDLNFIVKTAEKGSLLLFMLISTYEFFLLPNCPINGNLFLPLEFSNDFVYPQINEYFCNVTKQFYYEFNHAIILQQSRFAAQIISQPIFGIKLQLVKMPMLRVISTKGKRDEKGAAQNACYFPDALIQ